MGRWRIVLILVAASVCAAPFARAQTGDRNCSDFSSQEEAQAYFDSNGGSASNNVDGLDADNDAIPCEELASSGAVSPSTAAPSVETPAPAAAPAASPQALTATGIETGVLGMSGLTVLLFGLGLLTLSAEMRSRAGAVVAPATTVVRTAVYAVLPTRARRGGPKVGG